MAGEGNLSPKRKKFQRRSINEGEIAQGGSSSSSQREWSIKREVGKRGFEVNRESLPICEVKMGRRGMIAAIFKRTGGERVRVWKKKRPWRGTTTRLNGFLREPRGRVTGNHGNENHLPSIFVPRFWRNEKKKPESS